MNINSRLSIVFLKIVLIFSTGFSWVQAQNNPMDKQAMNMLRDFYTSYMTAFTDFSQGHEQRTNTILKKYCTPSLLKRIPKLAEQIDADPLLKAQDSDSSWAKSLDIKKDSKKPGVFIVSYADGGGNKTTIHLLLVKQSDSYKISDVW